MASSSSIGSNKSNYAFEKVTALIWILIIIFHTANSWYNDSSSKSVRKVDSDPYLWYDLYIDINTFASIGFGFSTTYLRKYAFSSLSMTMLILSTSIPIALYSSELLNYIFIRAWNEETSAETSIWFEEGRFSGYRMVQGTLAAITVFITFGVLLGRITGAQIMCLTLLEIIFFTINVYINEAIWGLHDIGFSINIHLFATYFGLAVSWMICPAQNDVDNKSIYHSDMFSLIGTLFLWLYFPSVHAYYADMDYYFRDRAMVNTVLALCGSTVSSFIMSIALTGHVKYHWNEMKTEHKFNILHVQKSSLAGGVAIGVCADLYLHPVAAICIGLIAGMISVCGYVFLWHQVLETKLKIADTRGIHNLHGLPAILGGFSAAIALACAGSTGGVYVSSDHEDYPFVWTDLQLQASYTIVAMCTTILFAIFSGAVTGWVLVLFRFPADEFNDNEHFKVFEADDLMLGAHDHDGEHDPFRNTIRRSTFGGFRQIEQESVQGSEDELGNVDWNEDECKTSGGVSVYDSMRINGMDTLDWRQCIMNDRMPKLKDISYTDVLRDYYFFDDGDDNDDEKGMQNDDDPDDDEMFYPLCSCAKILKKSFDVDSEEEEEKKKEYEYYLTARIKSNVKPNMFKRKHLNLVIVLDIQGSIDANFETMYDSKEGNRNEQMSKIIIKMIETQLNDADKIGVVGNDVILQKLANKNNVNLDRLKKEIILMNDAKVSTSQIAYKKGIDLLIDAEIESDEEHENRILFITVGLTDDEAEYGEAYYANDERFRIYTTVIGIGFGLTPSLKSRLLGLRGCNVINVMTITQLKEYFEERDKFLSLVTPIFYDIVLKLQEGTMELDEIFGTKNAKYIQYLKKNGQISKTFTLFAGNNECERERKSGMLLIKLKPKEEVTKESMQSTVTVSYEDREDCDYSNSVSIIYKEGIHSVAIRKSILLCQYTKLLIAWITDTESVDDVLMINQKYKRIFAEFIKHFENEMSLCNDKSLQKELDILQKLINY